MDAAIKRQWCEALRSGEFVQGRCELVNQDSTTPRLCPLGILCHLYAVANAPVKTDNIRIPVEVMHWAGLPDRDPWVSLGLNQPKHRISHWNDVCWASFGTIAKMIEVSL